MNPTKYNIEKYSQISSHTYVIHTTHSRLILKTEDFSVANIICNSLTLKSPSFIPKIYFKSERAFFIIEKNFDWKFSTLNSKGFPLVIYFCSQNYNFNFYISSYKRINISKWIPTKMTKKNKKRKILFCMLTIIVNSDAQLIWKLMKIWNYQGSNLRPPGI